MQAAFEDSDIEEVSSGIALPVEQFPGSCTNDAVFAELQALHEDVTEAQTYEAWLT
jgi:hypothetical protein